MEDVYLVMREEGGVHDVVGWAPSMADALMTLDLFQATRERATRYYLHTAKKLNPGELKGLRAPDYMTKEEVIELLLSVLLETSERAEDSSVPVRYMQPIWDLCAVVRDRLDEELEKPATD